MNWKRFRAVVRGLARESGHEEVVAAAAHLAMPDCTLLESLAPVTTFTEPGKKVVRALGELREYVDHPEFLGRTYVYAKGRRALEKGAFYTPYDLACRLISKMGTQGDEVCDPACGCGSFLVAAGKLLRPERLVGYDTDPEAVELARLAVALHADCPFDIKCRDALSDGHRKLHGDCFDLVAGNPPFIEGRRLPADVISAYKSRFRVASGKVNTAALFVERAFEMLRERGTLGFILPVTLFRNERYLALREFLLEFDFELDRLDERLDGATVEPCLLVARKRKAKALLSVGGREMPRELIAASPSKKLRFDRSPEELRLAARLAKTGMPLAEVCEVRDGINTGFQPFPRMLIGRKDGDGFVSDSGERASFDPRVHKPVIDGGEFREFGPIEWRGRYIRYEKELEKSPAPPSGRRFNCQLRDRAIFEAAPKLLTRQTASRLIAVVDEEGYFVRNTVHVTRIKGEGLSCTALCALFNSRLMNFIYLVESDETGRSFPQVHISELRRLPVVAELLAGGGELDLLGMDLARAKARGALGAGADALAAEVEFLSVQAEAETLIERAYGLARADIEVVGFLMGELPARLPSASPAVVESRVELPASVRFGDLRSLSLQAGFCPASVAALFTGPMKRVG